MKHYLILFLLLSLISYTRLQEEEKEDATHDDTNILKELMSTMSEIGVVNKEEISKQEYSQVITKYLMRESASSDFEYVKLVDKIVVKILETVPETVLVSEMDKYFSTELITSIFTDLLGGEYDLDSMMKETDL